MKRSRVVPLVLIGTMVSLAGCGPRMEEVNVRQNAYNSREDCKKDWGDDDRDCSPRSGGGYYGPRYIYNHGAGVPMAIGNDGTARPLSNSYLTKPGSISSATSATIGTAQVASNSAAFGAAKNAGAVSTRSSSVSRGGFGSSARASSSGG